MMHGDEDSALTVVQNLLDGDDNDNNRDDEENDGKMRMAP